MTKEQKTGTDTYSYAIANADNYTRWIIDVFRPYFGRSLLEVGLGHGSFRRHLPEHLRYAGTDIDHGAVAVARQNNPEDVYFEGDILAPDFGALAKQQTTGLDTVMCANVLEHVEDDELAVRNMLSALEPGGRLLLYLPAHRELFGVMDELAGHHRRYSQNDLLRISGSNAIVKWAFVNPIATVGWWFNRKVRYATLNETSINTQIKWFDRWVLPASRLVSPLTAKHFGLSLYCIIEHS